MGAKSPPRDTDLVISPKELDEIKEALFGPPPAPTEEDFFRVVQSISELVEKGELSQHRADVLMKLVVTIALEHELIDRLSSFASLPHVLKGKSGYRHQLPNGFLR
jgi:hypothetical protein